MIRGRARDVVDGAVLIEYPGLSDENANQAATALARSLVQRNPPGFFDAIPGARTLLVLFDPLEFARGDLEPALSGKAGGRKPASQKVVRIPICYGGELGPDLDELAREAGFSSEEFSRRHRESDYRVAFIGFSPGFPYLVGLPQQLHAPRLTAPRPRVPAGSVGIGGPYTGIYPAQTPGGWRLIGNAPVRLFDPDRIPPSLLLPGDRVAFEAIDGREHERLRRALATPIPTQPESGSKPILRIVSPGLFTSVQGGPRFGLGSSGVPAGGAMDVASLSRANAPLGNPPLTPGLEITLLGPRLKVASDCQLCVAGGEIDAALDGAPLSSERLYAAKSGAQLTLGAVRRGARAYLAIAGGVAHPGAAIETRRLEKGNELYPARGAELLRTDVVVAAAATTARPERSEAESRGHAEAQAVRVVLGPQEEQFTAAGRAAFLSTVYRVSSQSDRRGARLEGGPIELAGPADLPPEGTALGAIQVPGNGLPIVLGPDRPVTGGYAKIATVIGADLPLLAQARPGTALRFRAVSIDEAVAARRS